MAHLLADVVKDSVDIGNFVLAKRVVLLNDVLQLGEREHVKRAVGVVAHKVGQSLARPHVSHERLLVNQMRSIKVDLLAAKL